MQAVNSEYSELDHVVRQTDKERDAAPTDPQLPNLLKYKDMIKSGPSEALTRAFPAIAPAVLAAVPGIIPRFTDLMQRLMHSGKYNEKIGESLGIAEATKPAAPQPAVTREPAAAAPRMAPRPVTPEPQHKGAPGWLLPLILLALLALITYAFWPRRTPAARGVPGTPAPVATTPAPAPTPAATVPLAISDLKVAPGKKGALFTWDTDLPATGQIEYGRTANLEMGISPKAVSMTDQRNFVKTHSLSLMDLQHGVTYYYRVVSKDYKGNRALSKNIHFQDTVTPMGSRV